MRHTAFLFSLSAIMMQFLFKAHRQHLGIEQAAAGLNPEVRKLTRSPRLPASLSAIVSQLESASWA